MNKIKTWQLLIILAGILGASYATVEYWKIQDAEPIFQLVQDPIDASIGPIEEPVDLAPKIEGNFTMRFHTTYDLQGLIMKSEYQPDIAYALVMAQVTWGEIPSGAGPRDAWLNDMSSDEKKRELASSKRIVGVRMAAANENVKLAIKKLSSGDLVRVRGKKISIAKGDEVVGSVVTNGIPIEFVWVDSLQINNRLYR